MNHVFITDSDFANTDMSFEYLLGFQPSLGAMILGENTLKILLDGRYFSKIKSIDKTSVKKILHNPNIEILSIQCTDMLEALIGELQGAGEISLQNNIALKYYQEIKKTFPNTNIEISQGYFEEIRSIKTHKEQEYIKKAIIIIDAVYKYIIELANTREIIGKTEKEIRQIIIQKIFEFGGDGESFESIVAFGKNSSVPHHVSGDTKIGNGVLLIDMGAKYQGYCSDFTRTLWVGEKNPQYEKYKRVYKIVKKSHIAAVNGFKKRISGEELDEISRSIIQKSAFKDLFIHNLGHSLGLSIHEDPRLKKGDRIPLCNGMVFTIEPGVYIDGEFGVRLEDIVFVEKEKLQKYTTIGL